MSFFAVTDRNRVATQLINHLKLEVGMEVGVRDGDFAEHLLSTTDITLHGVDIKLTQRALRLNNVFAGRHRLQEGSSPEHAEKFADGCFDFIYIDADHSYEAVVKDLEAWWPKLRSGGIFCGDDYAIVDNPVEGKYGVVEAVNEFVERNDLLLNVVGVDSNKLEDQIEYARVNGEEATKFLRRGKYKQFQNPLWYVVKP